MKRSIVLAAALAAAVSAASAGSLEAQDRVDQRRAAGATGVVEINNTAGDVKVVGWDRGEVRVTGTLGRGASRVDLEESGDRVIVRVVLERGRSAGGSNIEVHVPARRSVSVNTVSADVEVGRVEGVVDVRTVSGRARVDGTPRSVSATSRSGDVEVSANTARVTASTVSGRVRVGGTVREAVEAASVSGNVEVTANTREVRVSNVSGGTRLRAVTGRASVNAVSGDVEVAGRRLSGTFRTVSGNLRLSGDLDPGGTLSFNTHSGDVELALPRNAAMELDFSTFSGSFSSAFPGVAEAGWSSNRQRRVSIGRGGPTVTVRTFSGDVKLQRR